MGEVEVVPHLAPAERERLAALEEVIAQGLGTFVDVGRALAEIRDRRLYLDMMPPTFEAYIAYRWGYSRRYGYNLIDAARVADAVSAIAHTPIPSEGVARELVPFLGPNNEGADIVGGIWAKTVAAHENGGPPTAKHVRQVLIAEGIVKRDHFHVGGGKTNRSILLGHFGDKLVKAQQRLEWFISRELGGKPLTKLDREKASGYASSCEAMARQLRALAEGEVVEP